LFIKICDRYIINVVLYGTKKIYKPYFGKKEMKCLIKKIFYNENDEEVHIQFVRFGKGTYRRRFLISFNKGKRIKIKGSFEWANDFVKFIKEIKDVNFSGVILTKDKLEGKEGKKKSGGFIYEFSESKLEGYDSAFFYLLNVYDEEILLKTKKKLPKPGKDEGKIDDKFCSLELDIRYWDKVKESFFWDVPECKKALIEHELLITDIEIPKGIEDPVEMRKLAKRIGTIKRKIIIGEKVEIKESKLSV
jgi:hypothetical protein